MYQNGINHHEIIELKILIADLEIQLENKNNEILKLLENKNNEIKKIKQKLEERTKAAEIYVQRSREYRIKYLNYKRKYSNFRKSNYKKQRYRKSNSITEYQFKITYKEVSGHIKFPGLSDQFDHIIIKAPTADAAREIFLRNFNYKIINIEMIKKNNTTSKLTKISG